MKTTFWMLLSTLLAPLAQADTFQLELGCCGANQSTNADTKLESDQYLNIRGRFSIGDSWGAEAGLGGFNDLRSETQRDNAGDYYLKFKSRELMLGLFAYSDIGRNWQISASAGWLKYQTNITLHESYLDLQPAKQQKTEEDGQGYYANLGLRWRYNHLLSIGPELIYRKQKELFSGNQRAFDLTTKGALLTLTVTF